MRRIFDFGITPQFINGEALKVVFECFERGVRNPVQVAVVPEGIECATRPKLRPRYCTKSIVAAVSSGELPIWER